jgi:hypothetical protein
MASHRRTAELTVLKRKIAARFFEKKVNPGQSLDRFIVDLEIILKNLHHITVNKKHYQQEQQKQHQIISYDNFVTIVQSNQVHVQNRLINSKMKMNYSRIVKRLKHRLRSANVVIQKTDKSKIFHLGKLQDYQKKSENYMKKTAAYECLNGNNPFQDLIERTNKCLLNLRLAHWITQKQYENLSININESKLAHLYYLPKAHKPGTPLRPIISGLKHPTIKISKFLDGLLRPLFNTMAVNTTVASGSELLERFNDWSKRNLCSTTILCTIDVVDLYTMIPQLEGILSIKQMMDYLEMKQISGLKAETIIRLSRFVVQNNFFTYDGKFYRQVRGGAMGSPLTQTMANCYMFFFERNIVKQINNSGGFYVRYIDDIFIAVNWPIRHLHKQIDQWNEFDLNIKLNAQVGFSINFLDVNIENNNGQLLTRVYHKPSHEPYFLPFNSIHPIHIKKNIPFTMLLRGIVYCSTFEAYINERESLRMALLLNRYPASFIDIQFNRLLGKYNINQSLTNQNYHTIREKIIHTPVKERIKFDYGKTMFVHFTYCSNMRIFPSKFHALWDKYFIESPINEIKPILGTRNVKNLLRKMVK